LDALKYDSKRGVGGIDAIFDAETLSAKEARDELNVDANPCPAGAAACVAGMWYERGDDGTIGWPAAATAGECHSDNGPPAATDRDDGSAHGHHRG